MLRQQKTNNQDGLYSRRSEQPAGSRARTWRNQKGFSLIEALTVVAVLAIIAGTAVPSFNTWIDNYQADAEARKVFYDLIGARTRAIMNATTVTVTFNTSANTYSIEVSGGATSGMSLEDRTEFGYNSVLDIDGNALTDAVSFGGGNTVTFNAKGEASASGAVYLIPKRDKTVGINTRMRAIRVVQTTGNISLYSYDASVSPPWD